ncbi:MAG: CvpA family protein [Rhodospirillaceae bacterium]|nr:CvpA family protein [Rhodospirillaceae bacterium]
MDGDTLQFVAADGAVFGFALISGFVGLIRGLKFEVVITCIYIAAIALVVVTYSPLRLLLDPLWQSELVQSTEIAQETAEHGPLPHLSILDVMLAIGMFFVLKMLIAKHTVWRWKAAKKMGSGWGDRWWGLWFGLARGPVLAVIAYGVLHTFGEIDLDRPGEIRGGLTAPWLMPAIEGSVPAISEVFETTFAATNLAGPAWHADTDKER